MQSVEDSHLVDEIISDLGENIKEVNVSQSAIEEEADRICVVINNQLKDYSLYDKIHDTLIERAIYQNGSLSMNKSEDISILNVWKDKLHAKEHRNREYNSISNSQIDQSIVTPILSDSINIILWIIEKNNL